MASEWVQKKRIRFKDCDPLGHLFNTRYLEYLLESREDMLMEVYRFNLYEYMVERGCAWVIVRHEIVYVAEAMRNECVMMRSDLIDYDLKKIKVEYQMWDEQLTKPKALLHTTLVHVDLSTRRSSPHPSDVMELFEKMHKPGMGFSLDDRVRQLAAPNS